MKCPFSRAHLDKLLEYCERGIKEGAKLMLGGGRASGPGLYMEPTIFSEVKDDMSIAKEESFGPIMIVSEFGKGDVDGMFKPDHIRQTHICFVFFGQK